MKDVDEQRVVAREVSRVLVVNHQLLLLFSDVLLLI
jgi:hypothetical protein